MYMKNCWMYINCMESMSVAEARERFAEVIDRSRTEAVTIERRGQRAAVVVDPLVYDRMVDALEELEDIAAFDEAMAEEGENLPWEEAKRALGWA